MILGYSQNEEEHMGYLREVLTVLQENKLFVNIKKCNFMTNIQIYLGFMVNFEGIHVNEEKVIVIRDWTVLKIATEM